MPTRVVLGCGPEYRVLLARLAAAGDLLVVVDDGDEAEWLTERDVPVVEADPTDPETLRSLDADPKSVVVATGGADETSRIAAAAREVFPDARLLSQPGVQREGDELAAAAGTTDPAGVVADRVLEYVASPGGNRSLQLRATLRQAEEPIAVLAHDNPDPDAIASAVALVEIAAGVGVEAEACYFGTIAHQENRALVNLLDLDLHELDDPEALEAYGGIALVDHARPGVNDQLPEDTSVDVVIDHHPTHGPDEAGFVDLRSGVGATSTLLSEYFDRLGLALTEQVATALLYGLRVDTDDFTREAAVADFEAAARLLPGVDESVLERVESPSLSSETMDVLARAIDRRQRHGKALTACVGELNDRDALAQAADLLLDLEDVSTTLVFGIIDDTVYVSGRARAAQTDLGETLRAAYGQLGSAGGHADMAGAQLPVGMLVEPDEEDPIAIVEEVLTNAFVEALETGRSSPGGGYALAGDGLSFLPELRREVSKVGEVPGDVDPDTERDIPDDTDRGVPGDADRDVTGDADRDVRGATDPDADRDADPDADRENTGENRHENADETGRD